MKEKPWKEFFGMCGLPEHRSCNLLAENIEELYQAFKARFIEEFFPKSKLPEPSNPYGGGTIYLASDDKKVEALKEAEQLLLKVEGIKWDALSGGIETDADDAVMNRIPFDEIAKWLKRWGFDESS